MRLPVCRSPHRAAPWRMGVGVSAGRVSSVVPCLSFKRHLCGPFFCASLEVRRPPRITRAIAARTRQSTDDTRQTGDCRLLGGDRTRPREGTTTPQVTDSTLLHTRHTDGKGRSGGGGGSGARAEQRPPRWSLLRAGARRLCAGSRVRPGGKAQASPWWLDWWRRRETRRRPAVAETRAFCTRRGER